MTVCSSPTSRENARRFLLGELPVAQLTAFESHLETCRDCQHELELCAADEESWQFARELLADPVSSPSEDVAHGDGDRAIASTAAQVRSLLSPTDDPEFVGRIAHYEVSGIIGRGGAGIVLKAFDPALNRNVAIKVLDPAMASVGAARQRFAREARAMASVSHENVVSIFDVREHDGIPYLVMDYVPGGSLERRLRTEGPLTVVSIVRIGQQTALALAAAHRQGLVHRDIKPGNILLDQGTERVRVTDFGLVRVANDVSFTQSGVIAGTPQFMSPEQVRAERCDGRSDLFSLGSVLYALCTGHPPFRAETIYGVMHRITHSEPRSIREQNPDIPWWLEAFVLRLLKKDSAERFESAEEIAELLRQELAYLQMASPQLQPQRKWMPARNHWPPRQLFVRAMLVIFGLVAAAGISTSRSWLVPTGSQPNNNPQLLQQPGGQAALLALTTEARHPVQAALSQADERTTVRDIPPHWNEDGTDALSEDIKRLQTQTFTTPDQGFSADSSRQAFDVLWRQMDTLERELTALDRQTPPQQVPGELNSDTSPIEKE